MELNESDFKSKTGKRLYYLIMQNGRETEKEFKDGLNQPPKQRQRNQESVGMSGSSSSVPMSAIKENYVEPKKESASETKKKIKNKKKEAKTGMPDLSEIVTSEQAKIEVPENKKKWELPPEYQTLSVSDALDYCIRTRNIPEQDHTALLKIAANVVAGRSTLVTGASNSGKSYTLNSILMSVPQEIQDEFADSKQFFKAATMRNGKFKVIHIDELQTFLRGSSNEKDAIRRIAYGELYDPKKEDGVDCPITAHGVFTCVADSNAYKKRLMAKDKELMRRFDHVEIFLDDDKIKQRNETVVNGQNPSFNSDAKVNLDLKVLQYHFGKAIQRNMSDGSFFNPFAQFFAEYIQDVCKEQGKLEESTEAIKGNKAGILFGLKWYGNKRKFEKNGHFKYISSIEDAFVAKLITDKDLERKTENFDWQACWESGLESLRASGYPVEIIAAYQAKQVSADNKLYVTNPFTKEKILLADLNKPRTGYLVVTKDSGNTFTEESTKEQKESIDSVAKNASASETSQFSEQTATNNQYPAVMPKIQSGEPDIIDAEYTIKNETKALPGEKSNLPVPVSGTYRPAPRSNGTVSSSGLPSKERKYITCKED